MVLIKLNYFKYQLKSFCKIIYLTNLRTRHQDFTVTSKNIVFYINYKYANIVILAKTLIIFLYFYYLKKHLKKLNQIFLSRYFITTNLNREQFQFHFFVF